MLNHDIQKMIDMYKNEEMEYEMSSKTEFYAQIFRDSEIKDQYFLEQKFVPY